MPRGCEAVEQASVGCKAVEQAVVRAVVGAVVEARGGRVGINLHHPC